MKTASICTIGDEILIGQIVDTNSSYIARELNLLGIQVRYMTSIGDDRERILTELGNCLDHTDIVIVTGGLGPTKDDITKIIVQKIKQNRSNNEKIGAILKTYGVAKVSELPAARYEAFLTDLSQI